MIGSVLMQPQRRPIRHTEHTQADVQSRAITPFSRLGWFIAFAVAAALTILILIGVIHP